MYPTIRKILESYKFAARNVAEERCKTYSDRKARRS
jgi:hypothetical protein